MRMVINDPAVDLEGIDQAIESLVLTSDYKKDFSDITSWLIKTGLGEKGAEVNLINSLIKHISHKEDWEVLIQIAMQELECGTEIKAKIEKELEPVEKNIEFIVKSGALNIWKKTYWFRIKPKVTLNNLAVIVKEDEITAVKSGTMQAFVKLTYCGQAKENDDLFTILDYTKVLDVKLPDVVQFK